MMMVLFVFSTTDFREVLFTLLLGGSVNVSNSVITGNSAVSILTSIRKTSINIVEI